MELPVLWRPPRVLRLRLFKAFSSEATLPSLLLDLALKCSTTEPESLLLLYSLIFSLSPIFESFPTFFLTAMSIEWENGVGWCWVSYAFLVLRSSTVPKKDSRLLLPLSARLRLLDISSMEGDLLLWGLWLPLGWCLMTALAITDLRMSLSCLCSPSLKAVEELILSWYAFLYRSKEKNLVLSCMLPSFPWYESGFSWLAETFDCFSFKLSDYGGSALVDSVA